MRRRRLLPIQVFVTILLSKVSQTPPPGGGSWQLAQNGQPKFPADPPRRGWGSAGGLFFWAEDPKTLGQRPVRRAIFGHFWVVFLVKFEAKNAHCSKKKVHFD